MASEGAAFIPGKLWAYVPRALDAWDRQGMMWFRHYFMESYWFWYYLRFFSDDSRGLVLLLALLLAITAWVCRRSGLSWKRYGVRVALTAVAVGFSDLIAYRLLKLTIGRLKPDVVAYDPSAIQPLSFPSSHAFNCFFICALLFFWATPRTRRRWAPAFVGALLLSLFVGASRVYWLLHFPTDVFAGWILGGALGWGAAKFFRRLEAARPRFTARATRS